MTEEQSWMYVCPECEREITTDKLLRVERLPGNPDSPLLDENKDLIRITYRCCQPEPACTVYIFELTALRRLFPDQASVMMPWPRVSKITNGIAVPTDYHTHNKRSAKDLLMERSKWELDQLETIEEFLLFCRGPLQPEELRKDTASDEDSG